jgi:hypothetical protein
MRPWQRLRDCGAWAARQRWVEPPRREERHVSPRRFLSLRTPGHGKFARAVPSSEQAKASLGELGGLAVEKRLHAPRKGSRPRQRLCGERRAWAARQRWVEPPRREERQVSPRRFLSLRTPGHGKFARAEHLAQLGRTFDLPFGAPDQLQRQTPQKRRSPRRSQRPMKQKVFLAPLGELGGLAAWRWRLRGLAAWKRLHAPGRAVWLPARRGWARDPR